MHQQERSSVLQPSKVIDYGHTGKYTRETGEEIGRSTNGRGDGAGSGHKKLIDFYDAHSHTKEPLQKSTIELKTHVVHSEFDQGGSETSVSSVQRSLPSPDSDPKKGLQSQSSLSFQHILKSYSLPQMDSYVGRSLSREPLQKNEGSVTFSDGSEGLQSHLSQSSQQIPTSFSLQNKDTDVRSQRYEVSETQPSYPVVHSVHPNRPSLVLIGTSANSCTTKQRKMQGQALKVSEHGKKQQKQLEMQTEQKGQRKKQQVQKQPPKMGQVNKKAVPPVQPIPNPMGVIGMTLPSSRKPFPAVEKISKRLPKPELMQDYVAATPQIFPHTCSLCNEKCAHVKDWILHQNTGIHLDNCKSLRKRYPEWDGKVEQFPSSSSKDAKPSASSQTVKHLHYKARHESRSRSRSPSLHCYYDFEGRGRRDSSRSPPSYSSRHTHGSSGKDAEPLPSTSAQISKHLHLQKRDENRSRSPHRYYDSEGRRGRDNSRSPSPYSSRHTGSSSGRDTKPLTSYQAVKYLRQKTRHDSRSSSRSPYPHHYYDPLGRRGRDSSRSPSPSSSRHIHRSQSHSGSPHHNRPTASGYQSHSKSHEQQSSPRRREEKPLLQKRSQDQRSLTKKADEKPLSSRKTVKRLSSKEKSPSLQKMINKEALAKKLLERPAIQGLGSQSNVEQVLDVFLKELVKMKVPPSSYSSSSTASKLFSSTKSSQAKASLQKNDASCSSRPKFIKASPPTMVKLKGIGTCLSHNDVHSAVENFGKTKSFILSRQKQEAVVCFEKQEDAQKLKNMKSITVKGCTVSVVTDSASKTPILSSTKEQTKPSQKNSTKLRTSKSQTTVSAGAKKNTTEKLVTKPKVLVSKAKTLSTQKGKPVKKDSLSVKVKTTVKKEASNSKSEGKPDYINDSKLKPTPKVSGAKVKKSVVTPKAETDAKKLKHGKPQESKNTADNKGEKLTDGKVSCSEGIPPANTVETVKSLHAVNKTAQTLVKVSAEIQPSTRPDPELKVQGQMKLWTGVISAEAPLETEQTAHQMEMTKNQELELKTIETTNVPTTTVTFETEPETDVKAQKIALVHEESNTKVGETSNHSAVKANQTTTKSEVKITEVIDGSSRTVTSDNNLDVVLFKSQTTDEKTEESAAMPEVGAKGLQTSNTTTADVQHQEELPSVDVETDQLKHAESNDSENTVVVEPMEVEISADIKGGNLPDQKALSTTSREDQPKTGRGTLPRKSRSDPPRRPEATIKASPQTQQSQRPNTESMAQEQKKPPAAGTSGEADIETNKTAEMAETDATENDPVTVGKNPPSKTLSAVTTKKATCDKTKPAPGAASTSSASTRTIGEEMEKHLTKKVLGSIASMKKRTAFQTKYSVLLISNLPTYIRGPYTENDFAKLLIRYEFKFIHENIYIIPQCCVAFVQMPTSKMSAWFISDSEKNKIVLNGSKLRSRLFPNFPSMKPFGFYKSLMELVKYQTGNGTNVIYIRNISQSAIGDLRKVVNKTGSVKNFLPLMNKVFIEFESVYDADRLGVWYSLLNKSFDHAVYRLTIPRSETTSRPPRLAANAFPSSKDFAPGATIPVTSFGVPVGSIPPFWVTMTTRPYLFPTVSPWFIIPNYTTVCKPKDIWLSCKYRPTIMLTGLPEGSYKHEDIAKLVWRFFPEKTLRSLTNNILVLTVQRRAFVLFPNWKTCSDFLKHHVKIPSSVGGQNIHTHVVTHEMDLGNTMEEIYRNLMRWSNARVPELVSLEERLLCVEISEMSTKLILAVTDVVGSCVPFLQYLPLANRIYFEMVDASAVTRAVEKISSMGSLSKNPFWSKVQRIESLKNFKQRLQDSWDMTINPDGTSHIKSATQPEEMAHLQPSAPESAIISAAAGSTVSESIAEGDCASTEGAQTIKKTCHKPDTKIATAPTPSPQMSGDAEKTELLDIEQNEQHNFTQESGIQSENEKAADTDSSTEGSRTQLQSLDERAAAQELIALVRFTRNKKNPICSFSSSPNSASPAALYDQTSDSAQLSGTGQGRVPQAIDCPAKSQVADGVKEVCHLDEERIFTTENVSEEDGINRVDHSHKNAAEDVADTSKIQDILYNDQDQAGKDQDNIDNSSGGPEKEAYEILDSVGDQDIDDQDNKDVSTEQVLDILESTDEVTGEHFSDIISEESFEVSRDAFETINNQDQDFEGGENNNGSMDGSDQDAFEVLDSIDDESGTEDVGQNTETSIDQISEAVLKPKPEDTYQRSSDKNMTTQSELEVENKDETAKRAGRPTRRSSSRTRASRSEEKAKLPDRKGKKHDGQRARKDTYIDESTEEVVYEIVDSFEEEPVQGLMETSGRRRSARGNKEDGKTLTADKPSPTITRSTKGRRESSPKKEASIEKMKDDQTSTRGGTRSRRSWEQNRQRTPKTDDKALSQERKQTKTDDSPKEGTYAIFDSKEVDDESATVEKAKRRPRKGNKTTKNQPQLKNDTSSKGADEEEGETTYKILDSVEDETVDKQTLNDQSKIAEESTERSALTRNEEELVYQVVDSLEDDQVQGEEKSKELSGDGSEITTKEDIPAEKDTALEKSQQGDVKEATRSQTDDDNQTAAGCSGTDKREISLTMDIKEQEKSADESQSDSATQERRDKQTFPKKKLPTAGKSSLENLDDVSEEEEDYPDDTDEKEKLKKRKAPVKEKQVLPKFEKRRTRQSEGREEKGWSSSSEGGGRGSGGRVRKAKEKGWEKVMLDTSELVTLDEVGEDETGEGRALEGSGIRPEIREGEEELLILDEIVEEEKEEKVEQGTLETHELKNSSSLKTSDKEVKEEEAKKTQRPSKRKHDGDPEDSLNFVMVDEVGEDDKEEGKEMGTPRTKGRPRKRTREIPVRKSTKEEQRVEKDETEEDIKNKNPLLPHSIESSSPVDKDSSAQSGDNQPEIQKTELETLSQSDVEVSSEKQQPEPECSDNQRENVMGENEEREGQSRADIKVVSKERRDSDGPEPKRSCSQLPSDMDDLDLPPYNPNNSIGQKYVVPKFGFFCNVCTMFYVNEKNAKEAHCRTQKHYDNVQKYHQKLREQRSRTSSKGPSGSLPK
ncbi:uncharacterized protein KZ484_008237 isoform 2-T2 [Pholidichthys leucotaenia]